MINSKKYKYILLAIGLFLLSFSLFAATTGPADQTYFEMLTSKMFDLVIETFDIKPGNLNGLQEWLLAMCFLWEFVAIYLAVSAGTNSLTKTINFIIYITICFCFLGIIPHQVLTGDFLKGVGGKYEGQYLDIDLYNFVNQKSKELTKNFDKTKNLRDTDSMTEGLKSLQDYCEYQADMPQCLVNGRKKLSPEGDGYVDPVFVKDIQDYVTAKDGCAPDDGILNKNLVETSGSGTSNSGNASSSLISKITEPFSAVTNYVKCGVNTVKKTTSKLNSPGQKLAYWVSSIMNIMMNAIINILVNVILMANIIELLFMLIFARYMYPFLLIEGRRGDILKFVKTFVSFGIIPILMKIGFWVTDALLRIVLASFFTDPIGFVLKFFSSPVDGTSTASGAVSGTVGTIGLAGATIVAAPFLASIAISVLQAMMIAIAALKIAILVRLTKMSKDLFNLNLDSLTGLGSAAMRSVGQVGALVAGAVATGGMTMAAIGSVMGQKTGISNAAGKVGQYTRGNNINSGHISEKENLEKVADKDSRGTEVTNIVRTDPINNGQTSGTARPAISPKNLEEKMLAQAALDKYKNSVTYKDNQLGKILNNNPYLQREEDNPNDHKTGSSMHPEMKVEIPASVPPSTDNRGNSIQQEFVDRLIKRGQEIENDRKLDIANNGNTDRSSRAKPTQKENDSTLIEFNEFKYKHNNPSPVLNKTIISSKNTPPEPISNKLNESDKERGNDVKSSQVQNREEPTSMLVSVEGARIIGEQVALAIEKLMKGGSFGNQDNAAKNEELDKKKTTKEEKDLKKIEDEANEILNVESKNLRKKGFRESYQDEVKLREAKKSSGHVHGALHAIDKVFNPMEAHDVLTLRQTTKKAAVGSQIDQEQKQLEYILSRLDKDNNNVGFNNLIDYAAALKSVREIANKLKISEKRALEILGKAHPDLDKQFKSAVKVNEAKIKRNQSDDLKEIIKKE